MWEIYHKFLIQCNINKIKNVKWKNCYDGKTEVFNGNRIMPARPYQQAWNKKQLQNTEHTLLSITEKVTFCHCHATAVQAVSFLFNSPWEYMVKCKKSNIFLIILMNIIYPEYKKCPTESDQSTTYWSILSLSAELENFT